MSAPPLSHHEILDLVAPYARRGLQVDLPASDRLGRRLRFRRIAHATDLPALAGLGETLQLESFGTGTCRLTRTLTTDGGLQATLQVIGPDPGLLLEQVRAVEPQQQFRCGPGYTIALSYELYPIAAGNGAAAAVLARGVARLQDRLTLEISLSSVKGVAADLEIAPPPNQLLELPEDLLAVLGWDWARLIRTREGWKTKLRLRGDRGRRTSRAEQALERAAAHLVETLGASPAQFHDRWHRARWGVVVRRALPVLTVLSMIVAALLLPRAAIQERPGLLMLILHLPTALIALSFCLQELPQFEIPPLPRRSRAPDWGPEPVARTGRP